MYIIYIYIFIYLYHYILTNININTYCNTRDGLGKYWLLSMKKRKMKLRKRGLVRQ